MQLLLSAFVDTFILGIIDGVQLLLIKEESTSYKGLSAAVQVVVNGHPSCNGQVHMK